MDRFVGLATFAALAACGSGPASAPPGPVGNAAPAAKPTSGSPHWIGRSVGNQMIQEVTITVTGGTVTTTSGLREGDWRIPTSWSAPIEVQTMSGRATREGRDWRFELHDGDRKVDMTCTEWSPDVAPAGATVDCSSGTPQWSAPPTPMNVWQCDPTVWLAADPGIELVWQQSCAT